MSDSATVPRAPTVKENPGFEILYWVGCAGSYDRRAQRVTRAVVALLNAARVNFAILGTEEKCTGDSARRLGDEFLFQELAAANIETLGRHKVRRIIAHCPHCVNIFLKDYPQLGGRFEVSHHTEFLVALLKIGRLRLPPGAYRASLTYHDPCYLARVNGIESAPRELLRSVMHGTPLGKFSEMPRHGTKSFCCGAGGGRMWFEENPQQRVSTERAREALATGAQTVAIACPFCLTMLGEGVAAAGGDARVLDVAEILAERMGLPA